MKDEALSLVAHIQDPAQKLNQLREYLQALVLRSLHESEAFVNLSFVGGTALRFVYSLPRFSDDLDFCLQKPEDYRPETWMQKIKNDLSLAGLNPRVTWNDKTIVHKSWIRIPEIMRDAGLAGIRQQNLSIKLELERHPSNPHSSHRRPKAH